MMSTSEPVSSDVQPGLGHESEVAGIGRRRFIQGVTATAAVAGVASLAQSSDAAVPSSTFRAVSPDRLVDTRAATFVGGWSRVGASVIRVPIAGRTLADDTVVPADATAVVFTLVGINLDNRENYLAAFPAGTPWNNTSNLNMAHRGDTIANLVTVRLGNGAVDVLANFSADIVLDIAGVYVPSASGRESEGRYQDIAPARRIVDTRNVPGKPGRGSITDVDLTPLVGRGGIDVDATAVSVNLTATQVTDTGFLTAYPYGESRGPTSSLNVAIGQDRAIGAIVKLRRNSQGRFGFSVFCESGAHIVVDVNGFFTGPAAKQSSDGTFVPVDPLRLMDTRRGHGGRKRLWPQWTREFQLPAHVRAEGGTAVLNATVTRTMGVGFFTMNAARTRVGTPATSSVNVSAAGQTVANHVISKASVHGCEVYSHSGGDVIADLVGYYRTTPLRGNGPMPPEPSPPQIGPPYTLLAPSIPIMNAGRLIASGERAESVVDQGLVWHWTGTGFVGNGVKNVGLFAHRTDAGGPFRYVDWLRPGDRVYVTTNDQRTYVYQYVNRHLTGSGPTEILAAARRDVPGAETLSFIACTVGFDRSKSNFPNAWAPTSLRYRIVVNLVLEFWVDDIPLLP